MAHEYEKLIKCPYCDHEWEDSWEFTEDEGTHTCGSCEKDFNVSRQIEVTYSTSKIDCEGDNHNYVVDTYHIFKRKFEKKVWFDLPEEKWEYVVIEKCTNCDDTKYNKLSKETYFERMGEKI